MTCVFCEGFVYRGLIGVSTAVCSMCAALRPEVNWSQWRQYEFAGYDDTNFRLADIDRNEAAAVERVKG